MSGLGDRARWGNGAFQAYRACNSRGCRRRIASDHHHANAHRIELRHTASGFRARRITEREQPDKPQRVVCSEGNAKHPKTLCF